MKRIPFTIEAWKAGGVPVTRSGEYVKQLTWFEGVKDDDPLIGLIGEDLDSWDITGKHWVSVKEIDTDLFLEVPCTKYYTHYYRNKAATKHIESWTNQDPNFIEYFDYTHIKTVEVEL